MKKIYPTFSTLFFLSCVFGVAPVQAASVNGVCGPANGKVLSSAPMYGLCSAGITSSKTGNGPWKWSCNGISGGSTAQCSASLSQGTGSSGSTVPDVAAAVGYNTLTFNSTKLNNTAGGWYEQPNFYRPGTSKMTQNGDGSFTVFGQISGFDGVSTAALDTSKPHNIRGMAFGGGYYVEATFKIANPQPVSSSWPAFWANDVETMAYNAVTPANAWPGKTNFGDWVETDFFELDAGNSTTGATQFHNWYGVVGSRAGLDLFTGNPSNKGSANWAESSTVSALWVPATSKTKGYYKVFYDGKQVGATISWNQYDPSITALPALGTTGGAIMDKRHMAFIFDSSPQSPMTVTSLKVWQKSADDNIVQ